MKFQKITPKKKILFKVEGKGDSIWGASNSTYSITHWEDTYFDGDFVSIIVYGENTQCYQYTDTRIPHQVLQYLRPALKKRFGRTIKRLSWSEQGMQPENGWNFDVQLGKKA